jgi:TP901 family phage tail tape measure protein
LPDYNVIIKTQIDNTASTQIANLGKNAKPVVIKIAAQMSTADIEAQVQTWSNKLTKMQIGKDAVFSTSAVQADLKALDVLIQDFSGKGKTSTQQVNQAFDNLSVSIKDASNNIKELKAVQTDAALSEKEYADLQAQAIQENLQFDEAQRNQLIAEEEQRRLLTAEIEKEDAAIIKTGQSEEAARIKQQEATAKLIADNEKLAEQQATQAAQRRQQEEAEVQANLKQNAMLQQDEDKRLLNEQKLTAATNERNNALSLMEAKNKTAYNSVPVQQMIAAENTLRAEVQAGTATQVELDVAVNNTNTAYQKQIIATNTAAQVTDSFGRTIEKNTLKVMQWMVATTLIYGSLRELGAGVKFIEDLNVVMNQTQIVTGQTSDQIGRLAVEYNKLASQLGSTTLEVATGALEWQRAGYSAADTIKLLTASTEQSKLANMDAATSTDRLIATLHGFQLTADDAQGVISALVALDNNYATSVDEISAALGESSSVAKNAGVTFQELSSYIAIVSSTTRQSGETVGNAFKTILTRMDQVKAGANTDDFGENLNQVETVLRKLGVQLRDTTDSFRPMGDVIDEIGSKWSQYTQVEQEQIATTVAGTRQQNIFMANLLP